MVSKRAYPKPMANKKIKEKIAYFSPRYSARYKNERFF